MRHYLAALILLVEPACECSIGAAPAAPDAGTGGGAAGGGAPTAVIEQAGGGTPDALDAGDSVGAGGGSGGGAPFMPRGFNRRRHRGGGSAPVNNDSADE